ncbi:MAG: ATP-dependent protease ATPase subunit HslU [Phycisphaera sp.]|nr:ATP-dependent protease ATPase subunit HslU [Phycisphaera sp.]
MDNMTPRQIVAELDRFIIGQNDAKRAVAVAIRNRWRRQQLDAEFAKEVNPKNIIMVGPTGVGKTEIARRIAGLTAAPFIKVEASKFTEVGYHGRDVESMVRDLLEQAIKLTRSEHAEKVREKAEAAAEDRLLDLLLPGSADDVSRPAGGYVESSDSVERRERTRQRLREQLRDGAFDDKEIEISIQGKAVPVQMFSNMGMDQMDPDMANMFENLIPDRSSRRRLSVRDARQVLIDQETERLLDRNKLTEEAIRRTEQSGIIFLDEIDKVASGSGGSGRGGGSGSPDVSRQGVQRDLLPIVEGSAVTTRHGIVNTDHILFIAAGAFHSASVSDLMPELQGRFPIRVELDALTKADFVRILTEPNNALTKQQTALLKTEGLEVAFDDAAIDAMAEIAADVNTRMENIGARRLMTIVEKLFDEINFDAPDMVERGETALTITEDLVRTCLSEIAEDEDLSKFVL